MIGLKNFSGGETGIRTQERVAPLPVFKTGAFNRSAISPKIRFYKYNLEIQLKNTQNYFKIYVFRNSLVIVNSINSENEK